MVAIWSLNINHSQSCCLTSQGKIQIHRHESITSKKLDMMQHKSSLSDIVELDRKPDSEYEFIKLFLRMFGKQNKPEIGQLCSPQFERLNSFRKLDRSLYCYCSSQLAQIIKVCSEVCLPYNFRWSLFLSLSVMYMTSILLDIFDKQAITKLSIMLLRHRQSVFRFHRKRVKRQINTENR